MVAVSDQPRSVTSGGDDMDGSRNDRSKILTVEEHSNLVDKKCRDMA